MGMKIRPIRVPDKLWEEFREWCRQNDATASQVVREFMEDLASEIRGQNLEVQPRVRVKKKKSTAAGTKPRVPVKEYCPHCGHSKNKKPDYCLNKFHF